MGWIPTSDLLTPVGCAIVSSDDDGTIQEMADDLERVLRGLEEARVFARTYRFEMSDEYRALIARVEALPTNQSGADRSGPWLGSRPDRIAHLANVKLLPRR